jgi:hypothetical protein
LKAELQCLVTKSALLGGGFAVAQEAPVVRHMDAAKAAEVAERVFSEHAELFRTLAQ